MVYSIAILKNEFDSILKMEKTDYKGLVEKLSSAYERRGRPAHDELLGSLKKDIGEKPYSILYQVVVKEYLDKKGADRLFGAFPEEAKDKLAKKCLELEMSSNKHLL